MVLEIWQVILLFLGGLATVIGTYFTARYTARSAVIVKELDVDGKAFERAEKIYLTSLERLEGEFETHRENSAKDIRELKERSTAQDEEITRLRASIEKVNGAFRVAVNFIEEMLIWAGDPQLRPRVPNLLREHLDPGLVARHARQTEADAAAANERE